MRRYTYPRTQHPRRRNRSGYGAAEPTFVDCLAAGGQWTANGCVMPGQIQPGGFDDAVAAVNCLAAGGQWTVNGCVMPTVAPPPGTGVPPGAMPQTCNPNAPCPAGYQCATAPPELAWAVPAGMGVCLPAGSIPVSVPPGTPPPSMPPQQPPPGTPPPGLPPPAPPTSKAMFGLPPMAVYIGLGALGLVAVAAIMKKKK